jgi:hypothetical protein
VGGGQERARADETSGGAGRPAAAAGGARAAAGGARAGGSDPPEPIAAPSRGNGRQWRPDATHASQEVTDIVAQVQALVASDLPVMGVAAGDRPAADVDALLGAVASMEYELARRMHAAERADALPMLGQGGMAKARFWSPAWSRRLARAGGFAARWPQVAQPWAAGVITSEHVDAVARRAEHLSELHVEAVLAALAPRWGHHAPDAVGRFMDRVLRILAPPDPDPPADPDELAAHANRGLSFALLGDEVILSGSLPRLEGELVVHAVEAWAERLRSAADHVPAAARRADGLVALVTAASAAGGLPNRGGAPVALSVTLDHTTLTGPDGTSYSGDPLWTTSGGHALGRGEQRFTACTGDITPVVVARGSGTGAGPGDERGPAGDAARIAALAVTLLDRTMPLAVGRTARHATPAQRRAMAQRDKGCVIPGCEVPVEQCQSHHLTEWATGGRTDVDRMVLLCWAHHRQVDLGQWRIRRADPEHRVPRPRDHAGPGARWPANHGSPWIITATPRSRWRS